jgi:hypothetical protein
MAKLFGCRLCAVELERVALADGSVAVFCATCDMIGVEHEVTLGGPMWTAGMASLSKREAPRPATERNFMMDGALTP